MVVKSGHVFVYINHNYEIQPQGLAPARKKFDPGTYNSNFFLAGASPCDFCVNRSLNMILKSNQFQEGT